MSDTINIAIIVLSALIHASLQLGLGALLLLYHESAGKYVRRRTRNLVGSFIVGVMIIVFLLLATACFAVVDIFGGALSAKVLALVIGALIALAVVMWLFYYRRGATTELWLPKTVARFIDHRAKVTRSNTEAFSLGVLTSFGELPFTIILMVAAGNSVLELNSSYGLAMIAVYTLIATLPLLIFWGAIRVGRTVVDIQKWRVKNKMFLRILSGCGFLILGIFILAFKVLGVA